MYDVMTIGDIMRDIFMFPSLEEMEKPISQKRAGASESFEKYLVFGLGDKISVSDVEFTVGGTAANVAVGLSKLGLKTAICSAIGDDHTGTDVKKSLESANVVTSNIKVHHRKKTSFSVIISFQGERTIFVYHGFAPESFKLPEKLNSEWLYLGPMAKGHERLYNQIISDIVKNNIKVAINPGSAQIADGLHSFGGLLKLVKIIFVNRQEAQALSGLKGIPNVKDMARAIHFEGPEVVVITDGKDGAYAYNGNDFYKVGIYPGHRLDATGAGDSFAAGYLAATIDGQETRDCLKWGVVNSASVVAKIGAQEGLLSKTVLKRKIKEYRWPAESLRFN